MRDPGFVDLSEDRTRALAVVPVSRETAQRLDLFVALLLNNVTLPAPVGANVIGPLIELLPLPRLICAAASVDVKLAVPAVTGDGKPATTNVLAAAGLTVIPV